MALCFVAAPLRGANSTQQNYVVAQTFALHPEPNGIQGTIQLLLDARLTVSVREEMWGHGNWQALFPQDSPLNKDFSILPPGNAKLEIRTGGGKLLVSRALEMPLAKLEEWSPAGKTNWGYFLAQDYSIGAGSYNGPVTTLIQIKGGAFRDVTAFSAQTQRDEPIHLAKTLKQGWRITSGVNGTEILAVSCHPNFSAQNDSFVVDYTRYAFDGTRWHKYTRQENGLWESDNPFPQRSAFP
jgi:hypothetical protein